MSIHWFDIDRQGLAKLLARKGKEFVLFELVQNAWDERTSEVRVSLKRLSGTRLATLVVEDDNPEGFADLSHAFTLFADSAKRAEAENRGRFNLGEKLVLALCEQAEIASTSGTIRFTAQGRRASRARRAAGSMFWGTLRMTADEIERCAAAVRSLIPPAGIRTYYNGALLPPREPAAVLEATLPTEVAREDGVLRRLNRKTRVEIHEPRDGEVASLYEMGIPVVATGDRWHVNVMQKVPLTFDRDNVPPAYLARVRALVADQMCAALTPADANASWVREAVQKQAELVGDDAVRQLARLRFGDKAVAYDPSDPEANSLAVAQGYVVVHGGQMTRGEWDAVRRAGALPPAGRVTPSPTPYAEGGRDLRDVPEEQWSPQMRAVVDYIHRITPALLGCAVSVRIVSDATWPFAATYGSTRLTLNLGRLGHKWFAGPLRAINDLLIHEYGHHWSGNHLASEYHDALTRLGAALTELALERPSLFAVPRTQAHVETVAQ